MPTTYYVVLFMGLTVIILLTLYFFLRKRDIPAELFTEALRNENSGQFEAAVITYKNALHEENKIRFPSNSRKNIITEKLKVLHTLIEYRNNFHITITR